MSCGCFGGKPSKLTLLHFNDVYDITAGDRDPVGGASRFAWKVSAAANCCVF